VFDEFPRSLPQKCTHILYDIIVVIRDLILLTLYSLSYVHYHSSQIFDNIAFVKPGVSFKVGISQTH